ncbi:fibrocystin-L-like [Argopecten irradians]|uniref:fibrocystin-L-like n=1 Tax=Argopecten irradians TaxID=31199 RepID=UPI003712B0F6
MSHQSAMEIVPINGYQAAHLSLSMLHVHKVQPPYREIQISGSGFSNIPNNNNVTIAGTQCNVTMVTNDSITCDIDKVSAGEHDVVLDVLGRGIADYGDNYTALLFTTTIDSIKPVSTGLGGFVALTISGSGFNEYSSVVLGTKTCKKQSVSSTTIVCLVPPTTKAETLNVTVEHTGELPITADTKFTYNETLTPRITDISPIVIGVSGGGLLVISGTGFQTYINLTVSLGETVANITFYNDTCAIAEVPPCSPGSHEVRVIVGDHGAAVNLKNELPTITCNLEIDSVKPHSGSLFGGTVLTLEGRGFTSNTKVIVGTHECDVSAANDTSVISFGKYYYWSPQYVSIQVGDVVQWDWDFPFYITTMKPRVEETYNLTAKFGKPGGFSSGVGSTKGSYTHEFNKAGTFYYWSGIIEDYGTTWFHGSVEVTERTSYLADVTVKQEGFEANYNLSKSESDTVLCCDAPVHMVNCSDPLPNDPGNNTKFQFAFWTCASPIIDQICRQNGTTNDDIVISGNGFSDVRNHNNVTFGDYRCKVSNSSVSNVTCSIDPGNKPRVGRPQYIDVYVTDLGYAHINIEENTLKTFALFPVITSINPSNGSLGGYTRLTVSGTGFEEGPDQIMTDITIGGYPCNIVSSSYTEIICLTPIFFVEKQQHVSVSIPVSGNINIPAKCDTSCQFTYIDLLTPKVTGVSPDTITGGNATRVFITGTGFGNDLHTVSVIMKSSEMHDCLVENVSDSEIVCSITSLSQGPNELVVDIVPFGRAVNTNENLTVISIPTVSDVVPSEGSIYGGTAVTIVGNGFLANTNVYIAGSLCTVKKRTVNSVIFTTEAHYAIGTEKIEILSGAIWYPVQTFNFSEEVSPTVMSVQPSTETKGENITIIGNNFGSSINETRVVIEDHDCIILSVNDTEITCTVGANRAGTYGVYVHVKDYGNSNNDQVFTFNMSIHAIEPNSGSLGGQQTVTILGGGFDEDTVVNICGNICNKSEDYVSTSTAHICDTPPWTESLSSNCDVSITVNNVTKLLMNSYTYDPALTPVIDDVTPTRGGTQGGTRLTISGSNFGSSPLSTPGCMSSVTIAGTLCNITSWSNTTVVCVTEAHSKSERATVRVEVGCNGKADEVFSLALLKTLLTFFITFDFGP